MKRVLAAAMALSLFMTGALAEPPMETPTAAPTETATESPTEAPAETPTDAPTETPTEAPTDAPTQTPTETPTDAPTSDPTGSPVAAAFSADPTGEALPPEIPSDAEAWMADPSDAASVLFGKLDELLHDFTKDTEAVVYIRSDRVLAVSGKLPDDLKKTTFLPDPDVFEADKFEVRVSETDPGALVVTAVAEGEPETPPELWLYFWVERKQTSEPPSKDPEPVELDIFVSAEGYVPGAWSNVKPVFTLSGIPEDAKGYSYAAIAYDERFIVLSGDTFTARDEGGYTVRFAILDSIGDVQALSAKYELKLDYTKPNYVSAALEQEGKALFDVSSGDPLSGLNAYSVDGGVTWVPVDEDGVYTHTGTLGQIYPPGSILARDNAGNVAEYPGEFAIPKPIVIPSGGGGGGGSGGGTKIKHTPSEDVDTTPYDALNLQLSGEPMHALVVGEEELPLTLSLDSAENLTVGPMYEPEFTALLTTWNGAEAEADGEAQPDTLVLEAEPDPAIDGAYTYRWQFNGAVYRMLFNSGVDYLVLKIGGRVTAISTAGFTAGTEYTALKAGGVSTRKFDYSVWMTGSTVDPLLGNIVAEAAVEGEIWPLSEDTEQPMYYYDLYYGPSEMMNVPFGAWQQGEEGA